MFSIAVTTTTTTLGSQSMQANVTSGTTPRIPICSWMPNSPRFTRQQRLLVRNLDSRLSALPSHLSSLILPKGENDIAPSAYHPDWTASPQGNIEEEEEEEKEKKDKGTTMSHVYWKLFNWWSCKRHVPSDEEWHRDIRGPSEKLVT